MSQQNEQAETKKYPVGVSAKFAASTLVASVPLDLLAHLGPTGFLVGGLASYVAWKHGPEVYEALRGMIPALPPLEETLTADQVDTTGKIKPEQIAQQKKQSRSFWDRAMGRFPEGYFDSNDDTQVQGDDQPQKKDKSEITPPPKEAGVSSIPPQFKLDTVFDIIDTVNAKGYVYFGQSAQNAVALPMSDMYHVFDVSSSGKGKSNRFRLAMMQMVGYCETYYINPFASNVKAVKDSRKIEVWKPIYDRLANERPMKEGPEILDLMTALIQEIKNRSDQENNGDFSWQERPIFVFIDELPEVLARCPKAIGLLDQIGRTGRQFCVFCWVASQTAAVTEIGQSTAAQANYKTRIYGGGDRNSSGRMMKGSISMNDELTLQSQGAGLTLMLADELPGLQFVRAPLVTNEALFAYLGLPPFRMQDWIASTERPLAIAAPLMNRNILLPENKNNLLPFPLLPEKESLQAQKPSLDDEEKGKGKSGKRGKQPHEDAILDAMDELEEESKALTLHAIAKKAGLTRHQYDEIEVVAIECGYELDRGKGRPPRTDSEKEAL